MPRMFNKKKIHDPKKKKKIKIKNKNINKNKNIINIKTD
jgi:hypothetical protein